MQICYYVIDCANIFTYITPFQISCLIMRYQFLNYFQDCILVSMYPDINVYSTSSVITPHAMYPDIIANTKHSTSYQCKLHTMHSNINIIIMYEDINIRWCWSSRWCTTYCTFILKQFRYQCTHDIGTMWCSDFGLAVPVNIRIHQKLEVRGWKGWEHSGEHSASPITSYA